MTVLTHIRGNEAFHLGDLLLSRKFGDNLLVELNPKTKEPEVLVGVEREQHEFCITAVVRAPYPLFNSSSGKSSFAGLIIHGHVLKSDYEKAIKILKRWLGRAERICKNHAQALLN